MRQNVPKMALHSQLPGAAWKSITEFGRRFKGSVGGLGSKGAITT